MIKEEKFIRLKDGTYIRSYIKETNANTWFIGTHGVGEHLGRHEYIFDLLSQNYNILLYDLRGHGKSSGKKGYIKNFTTFSKDLEEIIFYLKDNYKMTNFSLFGHSMGALITADFVQNFARSENGTYPSKVLLSAPPVGVYGFKSLLLNQISKLTKTLSQLPFSLSLGGLVDLKLLSHDPRVYDEYVNDKLTLKRIHTKLIFELINKANSIFKKPLRCKCILSVVAGEEDKIINIKLLAKYFNKLEKNAHLKFFPMAYHELHNEIEKYKRPYFEYFKAFFNNFDHI